MSGNLQDNPFTNRREPFDSTTRKNVMCRIAARKLMDAWYASLPKGQQEQVNDLTAGGMFDVLWDLYSRQPGFPREAIEALTAMMDLRGEN